MSKRKKRKQESVAPKSTNVVRNRQDWLIFALLISVSFAVYSSVMSHEFVLYDDDVYVTANNMVRAGLTWSGVKWAFTTFAGANWHPLTWLSHMVDVQIYGVDAGRHLLTNLALHILGSIFLFLALKNMTGHRWRSAIVAALFAVHPLHVESVAWIAERKDVLSGFLFMLTLWLYGRYVRNPVFRGAYAAVLITFAFGLMAKPMLVTLPFVLLLLDYWPLRRLGMNTVREKIPMFLMATGSGVITYIAQASGGAMKSLARYPLDVRLSNAVLSYARYLSKMFWPTDLAVLYPFGPAVAVGWTLLVLALLIILTAVLFYAGKEHPWMPMGWLWYGGMLVPVIGIVQVGEQSMADRYTYLPLVGIFVAAVWEIANSVEQYGRLRRVASGLAIVVIVALGLTARSQVHVWKDSRILFEHTISVTENNYLMENQLGFMFFLEGNMEEANAHMANAARIYPAYAEAYMNLGLVLAAQGRMAEAIAKYDEALRWNPNHAVVYFDKGIALMQLQKFQEALDCFNKAIVLDHDYATAHMNAGVALIRLRRFNDALPHFEQAVLLDPQSSESRNNLGQALAGQGRYREAEEQFSAAVQLQPDNQAAQRNLKTVRDILKTRPSP